MNVLSLFDGKIKMSPEAHTHFKRQQRIIRKNDYPLIIAEISAKIKEVKIWQMVKHMNSSLRNLSRS